MKPLNFLLVDDEKPFVEALARRLRQRGFGYLTKPCDLEDLIQKAEQAFARKKEREARIFELRATPFMTNQEREEKIQCILESHGTGPC